MKEKREKEVIICDDCHREIEERLARRCLECNKDLCNECAIETTINVHSGIISSSWNARSIHSCKEHYISTLRNLMRQMEDHIIHLFDEKIKQLEEMGVVFERNCKSY